MSPQPAPRLFSIRVASKLTGVPADTLRIWERRYQYPIPQRKSTGARFYTEDDIEHLKLVKRALDLGHRPSHTVALKTEALRGLLACHEKQSNPPIANTHPAGEKGLEFGESHKANIELLISILLRDQPAAVEAGLKQLASNLGPEQFVTDIAQPLASEVGKRWAQGELEVRHEHLLSHLLSTQLRLSLASMDEPTLRPAILLATLPDELHSLGLEMAALYMAARGATPYLLGVNTPPTDIVQAARGLQVDVVGLCLTELSCHAKAHAEILWMAQQLPQRTQIWLGGAHASDIGLDHPKVTYTSDWAAVDKAIAAFRA